MTLMTSSGIQLSEVLADLIADGSTDTPIEAFSIGRFRKEVQVSDKLAHEFDAPASSGREE